MAPSNHPPRQRKLQFPTDVGGGVSARVRVDGVDLVFEPLGGGGDPLWELLRRAGLRVRVERGDYGAERLRCPVEQLSRLGGSDPSLELHPAPEIAPLVKVALRPPDGELPAVVDASEAGLTVSWRHEGADHHVDLTEEAAGALLASDVRVTASPAAWQMLRGNGAAHVTVGRAWTGPRGFVEIDAVKPQLLEAAPIPVLFRLDTDRRRYGAPLAYAEDVAALPGISWEGPTPAREPLPDDVPDVVEVSSHLRSDFSALVSTLSRHRAAVVAWESGLGRRVAALAAVEALDAWPALVVTSPAWVWAWQRHLDLLGRSLSTVGAGADARVMTYADLVRRESVDPTPCAIVFDSLTDAVGEWAAVRSALSTLGGVADAYRVAVDRGWPDDLEHACKLLDVLKPGEFTFEGRVETRYPGRPSERARAHHDLYVLAREHRDWGSDTRMDRFRQSRIRTVDVGDEVAEELERLASLADPLVGTRRSLEVLSVGTDRELSPKVGRAAELARDAAGRGSSVAVVTRFERAADRVAAALPDLPTRVTTPGEAEPQEGTVELTLWGGEAAPDLRGFDEVIVVDYPWSTRAVDDAVGRADDDHGARVVTLLHAPGTIDDRLAVFAVRARELVTLHQRDPEVTEREARWLLSPRAPRAPGAVTHQAEARRPLLDGPASPTAPPR